MTRDKSICMGKAPAKKNMFFRYCEDCQGKFKPPFNTKRCDHCRTVRKKQALQKIRDSYQKRKLNREFMKIKK